MIYMGSAASISQCGEYRYALHRTWEFTRPTCVFVGLNPSTADGNKDDPTIRRCVRFAADWGYGGLVMLNLFAFRATNPKDMLASNDPVGSKNDNFLKMYTTSSDVKLVVAAWGANETNGRDVEVRKMLAERGVSLHHLGLTKNGSPKHPLYLRADTKPQLWGWLK